MKRLLLSLICCFPLLFAPSVSLSLELTGPSGQVALNDEAELYGPISRTETLWAISSKLKPDNSVSVHQTMVALYKLNPDAFDNGNINKIIANSTLSIPSFEFISEQTNAEAARLINKYSNKKVAVVKKEIPKVITPPTQEVKEPIKEEVTAKEQEAPKVEVNTVDKEQLLASEEKLANLQAEMQLLNEQFIVATESTQVLKLKLQPLNDEISILSEQLAEEAIINEKLQKIIDDYRSQLDAVELPPYSEEGLLNDILRLITSSLTNLLIVILTPVLLLALAFVIISRIGTKRLLAEQDQELAESTSTLMEEAGQFDQLLTDDVSEEDELDGPESLDTEDITSLEEISLDEDEDELELDVVDLTEEEEEGDDEELITTDDDPFGISALVDDEELISSVDLDEMDLDLDIESSEEADTLSSINLDDDEFEDPFGSDDLSESENDNEAKEESIDLDEAIDLDESAKFDLEDSKEISAAEQADLDLAAEWEAQLSAEPDTESEEKDDSDENELEAEIDSEERVSETLTDDELLDLDNLDNLDNLDTSENIEASDEVDLDDIDSDLFDNLDLNLDEVETDAELDADEVESEEIAELDVNDLELEAELDLNEVEPEAELDLNELELETESDVNEDEPEVDEAEPNAELDLNEPEAEIDVDELEPEPELDINDLEPENEAQLEEENKKDDNQDNLAKQLSDVAFNEEVPLPKVDKASKDDYIDIETLLENSGVNDEEPYSELDLDLGLEEFPDVVDLQESVDIDDDENGIGAQLDLARAYLEIDDQAGAKEILMSVVEDSNGAQRIEIDKLLSRLK